MKTLLYVDPTTKTVTTDGTSSWTPPAITYGETVTLALRFQQSVSGSTVSFSPNVQSLKATVGNVDARPTGGLFSVKIGTAPQSSANTTPQLAYNCTASQLASALNALSDNTYGTTNVAFVDGSFLIIFGAGQTNVPLTVVNNVLHPLSFGQTDAWQLNSQWVQEIRLIQLPLAFTDSSAAVLPNPPTISEVQAGGSNGTVTWNEIQAVYIPPDFRGTYQFKMGYAVTSMLSTSNSASDIQNALIAAFGNTFVVTNPLPFTGNIEFQGNYAGQAIALLEIIASNAPPGDLTFTLAFNDAAVKSALRSQASITVPFELRIDYLDDNNVSQETVGFIVALTINRPVYWPSVATVPQINWLQPPSPKDYVPFSPSQVITGQQFYRAIVGTGLASTFDVTHGLNTEDVFVFARENKNNGRQLIEGTDFTVVINSANDVTITAVAGAVALNTWAVYVLSAQTVAAFASGLTISIDQVTGLSTELNSLGTAVTALQALLPTATLAAPATVTPVPVTFTLPSVNSVFPPLRIAGTKNPAAYGPLFPSVGSLTDKGNLSGDLPAPATGNLGWQYEIVSPGARSLTAGQIRGRDFDTGTIAVSSGYQWFNAFIDSGRAYAWEYERELFTFYVNQYMLVPGVTLTLQFTTQLGLVGNCQGRYVLYIEVGSASGPDLTSITWSSPLVTIPLILTDTQTTHSFGMVIPNSPTGALSAQAVIYSKAQVVTLPGGFTNNFALRARLSHFDVDNATNPAGQVTVISSGSAKIQ